MSNESLAKFFKEMDVFTSKPKTEYVVLNSTSGTQVIQFIKPTEDIYKPRFYVKCSVRNEYSDKKTTICYDPKDNTNPLTLLVYKFKKLKSNVNSKNTDVANNSKLIIDNYPDLVNLVLGTGNIEKNNIKDLGLTGTEYFVANVAVLDNSGKQSITSGILSRGTKEIDAGHGKYTVQNLGISWYVLYQAFLKRNIDLYKDFNNIYNYAITVQINNPNFNDSNWFNNNNVLDILAINNAINTSNLKEFDIAKAIKYTNYDTMANKIGYIFKKIDSSDLNTDFNEMLIKKVKEEHETSQQIQNNMQIQTQNNNTNQNNNNINTQQQQTQINDIDCVTYDDLFN